MNPGDLYSYILTYKHNCTQKKRAFVGKREGLVSLTAYKRASTFVSSIKVQD